jgi:hypothetical protein
MAGSTVTILVPRKLTDGQREEIRVYLRGLANLVESDDFWVNERPFFLEFGWSYEDEISEFAALPALGFPAPGDAIGLAAGCRGREDDRILGMLAATVAGMVDGYISMGDALAHCTSDPAMLSHEGIAHLPPDAVMTLPAFEVWRKHKDFRMVN